MPTYDYHCADCGTFELIRHIAERDSRALCPQCGARAERILIAAPGLAAVSAEVRRAMATNERASHEPASSASYRHPQGCSCCKSPPKTSASTTAMKSFANKRPWMISH
ncbi:MAG: FmdB family zinc ribbon protein [Burkholderiales bacterium]